jgi:aldehyde dehydrogenase (NAD+)
LPTARPYRGQVTGAGLNSTSWLASFQCSAHLGHSGTSALVKIANKKRSSYGPREQGRHAQEFYTTAKTAYTLA